MMQDHAHGSEDNFDEQINREGSVTCKLDFHKMFPPAKYFGLQMEPVRMQIVWLRIVAGRTTQR